MQSSDYDAIVVGSGISGGWAAKELTEKGLRVLLLERGQNIEHIKDYVNATKGAWEYAHRGGRTIAMEELYPVLKRDYPLNEKNLDWWASDKDSPYTEVKRFDWYRGYHVGGRSLMWGRQSYRHSDLDFTANAKEGIAVDWPIRYADIAPWYDYVEKHAGIAGSIEKMEQLPDGQFLPAMPLNSAWLLLRSATDVWPGGLGSSSGELGHNLMDHHFRVGASGKIDGMLDKYYYGRRPTGFYIPRYRNLFGDKRQYLRGFGYQGSASRDGWGRAVAELGVGGAFKDQAAQPGGWEIGATAFGEMLPNHKNMVSLDETKKDKWGLPVHKIDCATGENERLMRKDMANDMAEMLEACGVKDVNTYDAEYFPGMGIHEMGTARMGRDPKTSVLNSHNQVWDAPNVFVTDGSGMVSAACVNPSLTYMALTARAADFAVGELNRRNL